MTKSHKVKIFAGKVADLIEESTLEAYEITGVLEMIKLSIFTLANKNIINKEEKNK